MIAPGAFHVSVADYSSGVSGWFQIEHQHGNIGRRDPADTSGLPDSCRAMTTQFVTCFNAKLGDRTKIKGLRDTDGIHLLQPGDFVRTSLNWSERFTR